MGFFLDSSHFGCSKPVLLHPNDAPPPGGNVEQALVPPVQSYRRGSQHAAMVIHSSWFSLEKAEGILRLVLCCHICSAFFFSLCSFTRPSPAPPVFTLSWCLLLLYLCLTLHLSVPPPVSLCPLPQGYHWNLSAVWSCSLNIYRQFYRSSVLFVACIWAVRCDFLSQAGGLCKWLCSGQWQQLLASQMATTSFKCLLCLLSLKTHGLIH